jgi:nucleotide-binding universal stress UspA family protein
MFERVVVGIDGFDGGRDALQLAKALCDGRATLVGAYPADPVRSRASVAAYERLLRDDLEHVLEAARLEAGVEADVRAVPDTSPARALHAVAEELDADLIVVGSSRHGALGRMMLGDVSRGVLHGAPCPVAVAPRDYLEVAPRTVAVGVDGSEEARAALDLAVRFADERGAALHVLVAWEDPPMPIAEIAWADMTELREEQRTAADRLLDETLAALPSRTAGRVVRGRSDLALAEAAASLDLMVVGSRGWGPVKRLALGSTSDRLIHESEIPVLVVPRPAAQPGREEPR